jgi:hypothetical protein
MKCSALHGLGSTSGVEGRIEDVILLSRSPPSYMESKVEDTEEMPPSPLLEDPSLMRRQIVASPAYAAEGTSVAGATDVVPKSEESSLLPAVPAMEQPTATALELVYGHPPPPPYPSGDLHSQTFKVMTNYFLYFV